MRRSHGVVLLSELIIILNIPQRYKKVALFFQNTKKKGRKLNSWLAHLFHRLLKDEKYLLFTFELANQFQFYNYK